MAPGGPVVWGSSLKGRSKTYAVFNSSSCLFWSVAQCANALIFQACWLSILTGLTGKNSAVLTLALFYARAH